MPEIDWLVDRSLITDVVIGFANAFDAQDWTRLRSYLADAIWTDYSAFRNEPPGHTSADAYVTARAIGLQGLRTLHISTNHQVTVDGDTATCVSAYRIYRLDPKRPPAENRLDSAGRYEHGLARTKRGWLITRIRQTVLFTSGNADIHGAFSSGARRAT
ncbi:MAG TPA: nuclear transport factor 2 family protein [Candidatus Binatia bacterium]|nr:nuclear transport factor 2 family protein [Candidatus Binatia bacterium]